MHQSTFLLDALGERPFTGYNGNEEWNGFACPCFDFDQAQELVNAWQERGWVARYDTNNDAFIFSVNHDLETNESEDYEVFPAIEVDAKKFYAIGAYCWTWENVECQTSVAVDSTL